MLQRFVFPTQRNEIKGKPQNEIDWMENYFNFMHLFCVSPDWEGMQMQDEETTEYKSNFPSDSRRIKVWGECRNIIRWKNWLTICLLFVHLMGKIENVFNYEFHWLGKLMLFGTASLFCCWNIYDFDVFPWFFVSFLILYISHVQQRNHHSSYKQNIGKT